MHPCPPCEQAGTPCIIPALRAGFGEGTLWRGSCLPCRNRKGGCPQSSHVGDYEWKPGPNGTLERVLKPENRRRMNTHARERARQIRRETLGDVSVDCKSCANTVCR